MVISSKHEKTEPRTQAVIIHIERHPGCIKTNISDYMERNAK